MRRGSLVRRSCLPPRDPGSFRRGVTTTTTHGTARHRRPPIAHTPRSGTAAYRQMPCGTGKEDTTMALFWTWLAQWRARARARAEADDRDALGLPPEILAQIDVTVAHLEATFTERATARRPCRGRVVQDKGR